MDPWLLGLISFVAVQAAGPPLHAWIFRRRVTPGDRRSGVTVMRHSPDLGRLLLAALAGIQVLIGYAIVRGWQVRPGRVGDSLILVALGLLLTVLILGVRHLYDGIAPEVGPEGFLWVAPWTRRRLLRWSEVDAVYFDGSLGVWRLRTPAESMAVGQSMYGLDAFAQAVLAQVPAHVIDARPGTRAELERLAAGTN